MILNDPQMVEGGRTNGSNRWSPRSEVVENKLKEGGRGRERERTKGRKMREGGKREIEREGKERKCG